MNAPLPEVFSAELDQDDVARLLGDVLGLTVVLGVTLKHGSRRYVPDADPNTSEPRALLSELLAKVRAGEELPLGIQLRYQHGGVTFYDTLMRRGEGWRLTRIAPPHDQPG
ncbi:MAG TPA: hypothetical protein PK095_09795 [Myxococcota bacterium]|nr:hypothetical protein [Myxococcota bacterium]